MKQYIILFESKSTSKLETFWEAIKQYECYAFISSNCCIIWLNSIVATPIGIRDFLMQELDVKDKIFVGELSAPAAWTGLSTEASDYIKNYLKGRVVIR